MKGWRKSCLALALAIAPALAHANLIVNGSFEDPAAPFWTPTGAGWMSVAPGSTAIDGWTIGGAGLDWHNGVEFIPVQDGLYAVDLNKSGGGIADTGTISQTFGTFAGQTYRLTFYLSGPDNGSFPDPRQVNVNVNGVDTVFSQAASPNGALVWGLQAMDFTATGASSTLTFSSVDGAGYWGAVVDNVSVEAVPAPAPLALLALGLLALGFGRRARPA